MAPPLLGITIDDKLSWNYHVEKPNEAGASGIGAIESVSHLVPPAALHLIYQLSFNTNLL